MSAESNDYDAESVRVALKEAGFEKFAVAFIKNKIKRSHFERLSEHDLIRLGLSIGEKIDFRDNFPPEQGTVQ